MCTNRTESAERSPPEGGHYRKIVHLKVDTTGCRLLPRLDGGIDFAGRRVPLRAVFLELEVGARDERQLEVLRVLDDGANEQDDVAVRLGADLVEVFRDVRRRAVR